jgi:hypothetical protein
LPRGLKNPLQTSTNIQKNTEGVFYDLCGYYYSAQCPGDILSDNDNKVKSQSEKNLVSK